MSIDAGFDAGAAAFTDGGGTGGQIESPIGAETIGGGILAGIGGIIGGIGDAISAAVIGPRGDGTSGLDVGGGFEPVSPEVREPPVSDGCTRTADGQVICQIPRPPTITPGINLLCLGIACPAVFPLPPCPPEGGCCCTPSGAGPPIMERFPRIIDGGAPRPLTPVEQLQRIVSGAGGGGGRGGALPRGAAGTRLVAAQPGRRSPLTTIVILAAAAGIGYYLWKRSKKAAG